MSVSCKCWLLSGRGLCDWADHSLRGVILLRLGYVAGSWLRGNGTYYRKVVELL